MPLLVILAPVLPSIQELTVKQVRKSTIRPRNLKRLIVGMNLLLRWSLHCAHKDLICAFLSFFLFLFPLLPSSSCYLFIYLFIHLFIFCFLYFCLSFDIFLNSFLSLLSFISLRVSLFLLFAILETNVDLKSSKMTQCE